MSSFCPSNRICSVISFTDIGDRYSCAFRFADATFSLKLCLFYPSCSGPWEIYIKIGTVLLGIGPYCWRPWWNQGVGSGGLWVLYCGLEGGYATIWKSASTKLYRDSPCDCLLDLGSCDPPLLHINGTWNMEWYDIKCVVNIGALFLTDHPLQHSCHIYRPPLTFIWCCLTVLPSLFSPILVACTPTTCTATATCPGSPIGCDKGGGWPLSHSAWPPPIWEVSMSRMFRKKNLSAQVWHCILSPFVFLAIALVSTWSSL